MSVVITVMNMKGGVGKTTVTMNVGGLIGRRLLTGRPRRVLLIDYDPQFNLSQAFIAAKHYYELEKQRKTTLAILQDDDVDLDPYVLQVSGNLTPPSVDSLVFPFHEGPKGNKVDIIPATLDLMYIALGQSQNSTKPIEERFKKFIVQCKAIYDVVMIDCHPAGSLFTKTSLQNSDHVLIPVASDQFAARGIGLMTKFIEAQKAGVQAPKYHIIFNKTRDVISKTESVVRAQKQFAPHCMTKTLRQYKAFSDPLNGSGFVWESTKPWSTSAYSNLRQVSEELIARLEI